LIEITCSRFCLALLWLLMILHLSVILRILLDVQRLVVLPVALEFAATFVGVSICRIDAAAAARHVENLRHFPNLLEGTAFVIIILGIAHLHKRPLVLQA
jgi:hypothetical protein